ncbi:MAG: hypothetical protein KGO81_12670 [Bacteroidota bacterium]|nr:hypothetical protein [Bacteroidota bacterium]
MKRLFVILLLLLNTDSFSQSISPSDLQQIKNIESRIKGYADSIVKADDWFNRFQADSIFTRGLVRALKVPYSFEYNFDSIQSISKVYAPDSSFRIFTWQVMKDLSYYRQRGAIQMRTQDGSLKLFPLFDYSDFTKAPTDSVRDTKRWIGAIYYKIILKTFNNKKYYTLLGFDENDARSNKKWIDILTFDTDGTPHFGGRYFSYRNEYNKPPQPAFRFCLEYKKDASARMNYDPKYDMIIFDRLVSESADNDNKYNLIPNGDYEGFKWVDGRWVYVNNPFENVIFDPKQKENPANILDDKGNRNEKKLEEISKKNQDKQQPQQPAAPNDPNKINDKKKQYQRGENGDY